MDDRTLGYILIAAVFAVALIASFLLARRIPPKERDGSQGRTASVHHTHTGERHVRIHHPSIRKAVTGR